MYRVWVPRREYKYITIFFDNLNWNWFRYETYITLTLAYSNILYNTCGVAMKQWVRAKHVPLIFLWFRCCYVSQVPDEMPEKWRFQFFHVYFERETQFNLCFVTWYPFGNPLRISCINKASEAFLKFRSMRMRNWYRRSGLRSSVKWTLFQFCWLRKYIDFFAKSCYIHENHILAENWSSWKENS